MLFLQLYYTLYTLALSLFASDNEDVWFSVTIQGVAMLFLFLFSFLLVFNTTELWLTLSGGSHFSTISPTLLPGILFILALLIYLSGNGKSFLLLFSEKLKTAELKALKKADYALSYTIKTLPFICAFFMLISVIYFYLNFFETQTLGINLSTVLDSILYLAQGELLLETLRGKLKRQIISYMDEDEDDPVHETETTTPVSKGKKPVVTVIKTLISIAVIIGLAVLVIFSNTINNSEIEPISFWNMADIPSLFFTFFPSLFLIGFSSNLKSLFKGISAVFKNERLTVTQKSLYENAFTTSRLIFLFDGLMCALVALISILFNLEDKSALGKNFTVACIPLVYALLVNLILLPVEGRLHHLADGE